MKCDSKAVIMLPVINETHRDRAGFLLYSWSILTVYCCNRQITAFSYIKIQMKGLKINYFQLKGAQIKAFSREALWKNPLWLLRNLTKTKIFLWLYLRTAFFLKKCSCKSQRWHEIKKKISNYSLRGLNNWWRLGGGQQFTAWSFENTPSWLLKRFLGKWVVFHVTCADGCILLCKVTLLCSLETS